MEHEFPSYNVYAAAKNMCANSSSPSIEINDATHNLMEASLYLIFVIHTRYAGVAEGLRRPAADRLHTGSNPVPGSTLKV